MKRFTPKLYAGLALGWVTYPTDSKDQGTTFFKDAKRAPFGPYCSVSDWQPEFDNNDMMMLVLALNISVKLVEEGPNLLVEASAKHDDRTFIRSLKVSLESPVLATVNTIKGRAYRSAVFEVAAEIGRTKPVPESMSMLLPMETV